MKPGTTLGTYTVAERIGAGGMAEVYRARDKAGRVCAVKVIGGALGESDKSRELFDRETQIALRLEHPNIVRTLSRGWHDDRRYLVVDWIEGASLKEIYARARKSGHPLSLAAVCVALADLADALGYAHTRPERVLHRDVSPDNAMVRMDGQVLLIDFGIATSLDTATLTRTNELRGKLGYMAPEYLSGEAIDGRTDLFALGVSAYWLCTGTRPFAQKNIPQLYEAMRKGKFTPLSERRPDLPFFFVEAIEALLAPDPADRPSDGQALAAALRGLVDEAEGRRELSSVILADAKTRKMQLPFKDAAPTIPDAPETPSTQPSVSTVTVPDQPEVVLAPSPPAQAPVIEHSWLPTYFGAALALIGVLSLAASLLLGGSPAPTPTPAPLEVAPPPSLDPIREALKERKYDQALRLASDAKRRGVPGADALGTLARREKEAAALVNDAGRRERKKDFAGARVIYERVQREYEGTSTATHDVPDLLWLVQERILLNEISDHLQNRNVGMAKRKLVEAKELGVDEDTIGYLQDRLDGIERKVAESEATHQLPPSGSPPKTYYAFMKKHCADESCARTHLSVYRPRERSTWANETELRACAEMCVESLMRTLGAPRTLGPPPPKRQLVRRTPNRPNELTPSDVERLQREAQLAGMQSKHALAVRKASSVPRNKRTAKLVYVLVVSSAEMGRCSSAKAYLTEYVSKAPRAQHARARDKVRAKCN